MEPLQRDIKYTYADYATWDGDERYELITGIPYLMASPSEAHQRISMRLIMQLGGFLQGKPCELFHAPFDVCLPADGDEDDTVVQPDLLVVCDKTKLDGKRCNGVPDMIIEIVSPSSSGHDRLTKFNLYLNAGVREYWVVDPDVSAVQIHLLTEAGYTASAYGIADTVNVHVLDGCQIHLEDVFA